MSSAFESLFNTFRENGRVGPWGGSYGTPPHGHTFLGRFMHIERTNIVGVSDEGGDVELYEVEITSSKARFLEMASDRSRRRGNETRTGFVT